MKKTKSPLLGRFLLWLALDEEEATELIGDFVGNDNGLCESNETCLATPNIGAYQGHGVLVRVGSIGAGGVLEHITLVRYASNGF